ncbi:MAG: dual specificity protein phosphatase family protein [Elusimicrobia bacterium]|nr:dual specificity protein phosphatase family protein [Elusimicrobiota bacterium]
MGAPWRKGSHLWIPGAFFAVSGMLAWLAFERAGWSLALLWPAANCAAVGAAYFGAGGRVFGKARDGSMRGPRSWAMLPFLAVVWAVWRLQVALSPERCWDEPAPGILLGRRPRRGEHPPDLELVVDLTAEFPKPGYHPGSAGYRCLPTLDAFVPEEASFLALLEEAARARRVFVHCANGHGRSAAFAAALLLRRGLASEVGEAMALIRRARPACRLNPVQARLASRGCR